MILMKNQSTRCLYCLAALVVFLLSCSGPGNISAQRNDPAAADNKTGGIVVPPVAPKPPDGTGEPSQSRLPDESDYEKAISDAVSALSSNPADIKLKEKLADAYIDRAWYYKAKRLNTYTSADLFKAVEIAPDYYLAYYELGRFHNNQWQFGIGIFDLNKALSLKPDFAPAYSERAYAYYKNQRYEQALADADKAVGLDPLDPRSYCTRSLIYVATARPDLAQADADKAVQIAPSDAFSYYNRSLVYTAIGKPDLAIADLATTLKLSGDDLLTTRANADLQKLRK
jgi:tetratricopeptide (TPR) repeat protein